MTTAIVTLIMILGSWITGKDIPENASSALIWFGGIVISWAYGTSAYESISRMERCPEEEGDGDAKTN